MLLVALLSLAAVAVPRAAAAQEGETAAQDSVYRLELADGSTFFGRVESETSDRLVFITLSGVRLEVSRSQVRILEPASGRVVEGELWPDDPNATRLFFGPTARSLRSGTGYVGLFELFFSFGAVGAGDHLVLSGGTPVLPEVIGRVLYLAPKARLFTAGGTSVAVGAISFVATEELNEGSVGIVYGVTTVEDEDRSQALTLGAGWGFALSNGAELSNDPILLVGGEGRTSRRVKLITENYFILGGEAVGILTGGFRLLGDRFSADLGAGLVYGDSDVFCCLPVLSAAYTF